MDSLMPMNYGRHKRNLVVTKQSKAQQTRTQTWEGYEGGGEPRRSWREEWRQIWSKYNRRIYEILKNISKNSLFF